MLPKCSGDAIRGTVCEGGEETIDGRIHSEAYALFKSDLLDSIEVGTARSLQQIHAYLFGRLYFLQGKA